MRCGIAARTGHILRREHLKPEVQEETLQHRSILWALYRHGVRESSNTKYRKIDSTAKGLLSLRAAPAAAGGPNFDAAPQGVPMVRRRPGGGDPVAGFPERLSSAGRAERHEGAGTAPIERASRGGRGAGRPYARRARFTRAAIGRAAAGDDSAEAACRRVSSAIVYSPSPLTIESMQS
jgi:hypothetical protein